MDRILKYLNAIDYKTEADIEPVSDILKDAELSKLLRYTDMVLEANKRMNLTGATSDDLFIERHIVDSLTLLNFVRFKEGDRVVDMGSGAGLPGIPLALSSDADFVLVDSLKKRISFLDDVRNELGLENVELSDMRAEEFARDCEYRALFDYAVSRALAPLNVLLEYVVPTLKVGGIFYAYKGAGYLEELKNAEFAMSVLGVEHHDTLIYTMDGGVEFAILVIKKIGKTPDKYPRRVGIPSKRPLKP